jgi:hypothetical protein
MVDELLHDEMEERIAARVKRRLEMLELLRDAYTKHSEWAALHQIGEYEPHGLHVFRTLIYEQLGDALSLVRSWRLNP